MSKTIIKIENLSKQYRLGTIGTGTIAHDLNRWWQTKILHNEDPYLKIGEVNDRAHKGQSEYVWALKDINLEVKEGDVVGIIGKNGAGKSTLLKILSRVTAPTTGSIKVCGRLASLLEVGTGFHPELTGRENIFLNGAILGMTKAEIHRKLDEIIDFSGCERYIDTPVKRYSSGMNVRLGFAVAAFLEPEILVVDEVLAVGDAEFQKKAIGKMQDVSTNDGRTVLFVSHNMAAVAKLCKSGITLSNGVIKTTGNISVCIDDYLEIKDGENTIDNTYLTKNKVITPIIEKITLIKEIGESRYCNTFYHNEHIIIKIEWSNFTRVKGISLGIALLDNRNEKLFTSHFDIIDTHNEKGIAYCYLPENILNQGRYSFDVAIFQKAGQTFEYLESKCHFNVVDKGSNEFYHAGQKIGSFRVKCNWTNH